MIRIPTRTHGILDLVYAATFLAAPFILKAVSDNNSRSSKKSNGRKKSAQSNNSTEMEDILLPSLGAGILAQTLMTDFELGAMKTISMRSHLTLDLGLGAFMMAAPFVMDMDEKLTVPMVAMGAAAFGLALLTQTEPSYYQFDDILDEPDAFVEEISHIL